MSASRGSKQQKQRPFIEYNPGNETIVKVLYLSGDTGLVVSLQTGNGVVFMMS